MSTPTSNQIEVRLRELSQLFNSMDPSPFIDRDLDAAAEEFIVSWARELPHKAELELVIHLATQPAPDRSTGTAAAVRHYFSTRAEMTQREFRLLMRRAGRACWSACCSLRYVLGLGNWWSHRRRWAVGMNS